MRTPRQAARIAVLDPDGNVFFFHYDDVEVGLHWAMPGGGLDPGETPRGGAKRELREETGWTDLEPGPLLCTWEHDYTRGEVQVRQYEHIYIAYGPHRDPSGDLTASHLEDGILAWRWWTPDDLASTTELIWPPQLSALLTDVRRNAPLAPTPVDLGYVPNEPR
jgi:ADP-ribose pyrophosphatase YjhB (NUDIX family)